MRRTTVRLDDGLMRDAKRLASEQGITLTQLISDALRERMTRGQAAKQTRRVNLPVSRSRGGAAEGVDLDDSAALLEAMEHSAPFEQRR